MKYSKVNYFDTDIKPYLKEKGIEDLDIFILLKAIIKIDKYGKQYVKKNSVGVKEKVAKSLYDELLKNKCYTLMC